MQRGGSPTSRERLMAARFGYIAVKALLEGKTNVAVGIWKGEYTYTSLADAVKKCQNRPCRFGVMQNSRYIIIILKAMVLYL